MLESYDPDSDDEDLDNAPFCNECNFINGHDEKFVQEDDFADGKILNLAIYLYLYSISLF